MCTAYVVRLRDIQRRTGDPDSRSLPPVPLGAQLQARLARRPDASQCDQTLLVSDLRPSQEPNVQNLATDIPAPLTQPLDCSSSGVRALPAWPRTSNHLSTADANRQARLRMCSQPASKTPPQLRGNLARHRYAFQRRGQYLQKRVRSCELFLARRNAGASLVVRPAIQTSQASESLAQVPNLESGVVDRPSLIVRTVAPTQGQSL